MKIVGVVPAVVMAALLAGASAAWAQARTFSADLIGDEEVPARVTGTGGIALFAVNGVETKLKYRLIVDNINNASAAHIHRGVEGENGEIRGQIGRGMLGLLLP
jgi:hypothetical protein